METILDPLFEDFLCECPNSSRSYPDGYTGYWVCKKCGGVGLDQFNCLLEKEEKEENAY